LWIAPVSSCYERGQASAFYSGLAQIGVVVAKFLSACRWKPAKVNYFNPYHIAYFHPFRTPAEKLAE